MVTFDYKLIYDGCNYSLGDELVYVSCPKCQHDCFRP